MTSFIGWVGVDHRGPASVYLATDSRISWNKGQVWDHGRKLFMSNTGPHLFGYVGDVLFPALVLAQVVSAIDMGTIFPINADPPNRFLQIQSSIKLAFTGYPIPMRRDFTIVYVTRELEKMDSTFHVFTLSWSLSHGWDEQAVMLPTVSSSFQILGSGKSEIIKWVNRWESTKQGGTSRAVFSGFCDAIHSNKDSYTGGAPQLIGIYRIGNGKVFGIVQNGKPHLFGIPLDPEAALNSDIEWRNTIFERCDAIGTLLPDSKKHQVPKGLGLKV